MKNLFVIVTLVFAQTAFSKTMTNKDYRKFFKRQPASEVIDAKGKLACDIKLDNGVNGITLDYEAGTIAFGTDFTMSGCNGKVIADNYIFLCDMMDGNTTLHIIHNEKAGTTVDYHTTPGKKSPNIQSAFGLSRAKCSLVKRT